MAHNDKVTLKARVDLVDPNAGEVAAGEDFETTEHAAKMHTRANAVDGAGGETAQEISERIALEEYEKNQKARKAMAGSRQSMRNLTVDAMQRGNVGVQNPQPQSILLGGDQEQRTNEQAVDVNDQGADNVALEPPQKRKNQRRSRSQSNQDDS